MIEGRLLPRRPALLAATIGISIIGPKNLPVRSLPSFLTVHRGRVKDALQFLKEENELYREVEISEEQMDLLPEGGVPSELLSIVKYSGDTQLLEEERAGYVVEDEDEDGNNTGDFVCRFKSTT
jgi:hypothetical protein